MSVYSTYLTNSLIAKKSFEIILLFLLMEFLLFWENPKLNISKDVATPKRKGLENIKKMKKTNISLPIENYILRKFRRNEIITVETIALGCWKR